MAKLSFTDLGSDEELGIEPCRECPDKPRCTHEEIACHAFVQYINTGRFELKHRKRPTAGGFDAAHMEDERYDKGREAILRTMKERQVPFRRLLDDAGVSRKTGHIFLDGGVIAQKSFRQILDWVNLGMPARHQRQ